MKWNIKPILALLAAAVLLCAVIPLSALGLGTADGARLSNGGFEDGVTGWTMGGSTALQAGDAHSGDNALLLSHSYAWGEALTRTVAVEANADYTLSFWYKRVSGSGAWDVFAYKGDMSGVLSYTAGTVWFGSSAAEWVQHTVTFNTGAETALFLKFCPESASAGTFLLDDVSLTKVGEEPDNPDDPDNPDNPDNPDEPDDPDNPDDPDVPAAQPFQNGGFESGAEPWTLGGGTALDTGDPHGGNNALLLSHTTAWGEAAIQTVALEPNTDYVLSFWTKRVTGGGTWDAYILDPATLMAVGSTWFKDMDNTWVKHTLEFHSGNLTYGIIKFCPESASAGTFLLDDVSLTVKQVTYGVINGGFEEGTDGWDVKGDTALDTGDPHGGNNALLMVHPSAYGEAAMQTVVLEKNTAYTLTFWVKRQSGGGTWNVFLLDPANPLSALPYTGGDGWFSDTASQWVKKTLTFNSGTYSQAILKFCPESASAGTFLLDDVAITKEGDTPTPDDPIDPIDPVKPLVLTSYYGQVNNRPINNEANLIVGGDFETDKDAQWNTDTFLADNVTVVKDTTAKEGDRVLFFDTAGTETNERHIFWVDVEPNTDYVFSAWLKGAFLSEDNLARGTIGVIDPDTKDYLVDRTVKFSTADRQLVPPAWDNCWHLRGVTFHSGDKTKVGIALSGYGSQMWVDGMALFRGSDSRKYMSANMLSTVSIRYSIDQYTCKDKDSLTGNIRMEDAASDFWQSGSGWRNGFLSFADNEYEYGTSLKYTASQDPVGIHYIKWLDVEPNTEYVFSADIKILEEGEGRLVLLDGKERGALAFMQTDFSTFDYGEDWFKTVIKFDTDVYTTIGIGVVDAGGQALIDNVRLFKADEGADVTDPFVDPPAPSTTTTTTTTAATVTTTGAQSTTTTVPTTEATQPTEGNTTTFALYPEATDPTESTTSTTLAEVTAPTETVPSTTTTAPVSTTAPAGAGDTSGFSQVLVWVAVGVGAAVLLAGIGLVIVLVIKKRRQTPTEN